MAVLKVEFEVPDSLADVLNIEVGTDREGNLRVLFRTTEEIFAEDFQNLLNGMKEHGFELYSLYGDEDGLEITFVRRCDGRE